MSDAYVSPLVAEPAEVRAARGAALLDATLPNWFTRIPRPAELNQSLHHDCVLGQLFGSYAAGLRIVGINPYGYEVIDNGFAPHSAHVLADDNMKLTAAWLAEIAARLAGVDNDASI